MCKTLHTVHGSRPVLKLPQPCPMPFLVCIRNECPRTRNDVFDVRYSKYFTDGREKQRGSWKDITCLNGYVWRILHVWMVSLLIFLTHARPGPWRGREMERSCMIRRQCRFSKTYHPSFPQWLPVSEPSLSGSCHALPLRQWATQPCTVALLRCILFTSVAWLAFLAPNS